MSENENKFLNLLNEGGRIVDNIKFLPKESCNSVDELFDAAYNAIKLAFEGNSTDKLPLAGHEKIAIGEVIHRV